MKKVGELRVLTGICALVILLLSPSLALAETLINVILDARKQVSEMTARFDQVVHSQLLSEPLLSRGSIYYSTPDVLLVDVNFPTAFHIKLVGSSIEMNNGRETQSLSREELSENLSYLTTVQALLAGNLAELEKHNRLHVEGQFAAWSISFQPLSINQIKRVSTWGSEAELSKIQIEKNSGDRIELTVTATQTSFK